MSHLDQFMNKQVEVKISGKNGCTGKLIDVGLDVLVLVESDSRFYYIPLVHVQNLKESSLITNEADSSAEKAIDCQDDGLHTKNLSFRTILTNAKSRFVEIYVTGNKTVHGYVTSIMNDYFVFYSPVYKAMFVSMNHVKWLLPYRTELTPYTLSNSLLPVNPVHLSLSRTFEEQCKTCEGKLVIFDLGDDPNKTGLLRKADKQIIELVIANGDKVCWNLQHVKTASLPFM